MIAAKSGRPGFRTLAFVSILGSLAPAWAGTPDYQVANNSVLDAICRVRIGGQGMGTGTVFEKKVANRDALGRPTQYWLCVITAGHVTVNQAPANIDVRFGNQPLVGADNTPGGTASFKWDNPVIQFSPTEEWPLDLSVLGVLVNANAFFDNLSPIPISKNPVNEMLPDNDPGNNPKFSSIGYGVTGTYFNNGPAGFEQGYRRQDGTFGVKRFQNQRVNAQGIRPPNDWEPEEYVPGIQYCGPQISFVLDGPGAANRVDGEGMPFGGDSGAPYLFGDLVRPYSTTELYDWSNGNQLRAYSRGLWGIHSGARSANPPLGVRDYRFMGKTEGYGVSLTTWAVRSWVHDQCMQVVPEPGTFLVLLPAVAAVFARRRRR